MEARIVEVTPPRGPVDLHIWQIETRPSSDLPWRRSTEGPDTNTEEVILRNRISEMGWTLISDASRFE